MNRLLCSLLVGCCVAQGAAPAAALSLEQLEAPLPGMRASPPGVTSWDLLGKASVHFEEKEDGAYTATTLIPPETPRPRRICAPAIMRQASITSPSCPNPRPPPWHATAWARRAGPG